jgi:membrane-bound lytic murein transglycosylase B
MMNKHSFSKLIVTIIGICLCWTPLSHAQPNEKEKNFTQWMVEFRSEASAAGISQQTLERALAEIEEPLPKVIALDRKQPEFTQTVEDYIATRVSDQRITDGRRMLRRYPTWLGRIEDRHRVQRRFIVALWGIETNYGSHTGSIPVIESLASLAYDGRRSDYFRRELLEALRIIDAGDIPLRRMKGSWAGAMGQCQFMPSVFRRYAIDADGDHRRNIWTSVPDVLASAANYLAASGWKDDQTWGRPVRLPKEFDTSLAGLETRLPLGRWQALGVRRIDGRALPRRDMDASLILPDGPGSQAYLVYDNFRVLRVWNKSNAFALAVGLLSDRLAGRK